VDVLLVSQYYPPETGATQNRLGTFAGGLATRGHRVTVICEQPCHPAGVFQEGFGHRPVMTERGDRITVHRLWVMASPRKDAVRRMAFYGTFAAGVPAAVSALRRHDVMFASSPPLPGVLTAAAAAAMRRMPLVVDVRDIWPAAAEALGELSHPRILRTFECAEAWLYRRAARVTATTEPFCKHIDRVAGRRVSVHLPNGALDELLEMPDQPPEHGDGFVVGYAGNLGIAQGLDIVLDAAERLRDSSARFVLVGDGPVGDHLRKEQATRRLSNVEIRQSIPVADVGRFLQDCDALLVPLSNHPLLADFIPSKLYDAMAVGRPAIVAATGEAAALVRRAKAGVVVPPEDGAALEAVVRELSRDRALARRLGAAGRAAATGLRRSRQMERLEEVLAEAAGAGTTRDERGPATRCAAS
jgi:glycosyltransferase involved in cell wall biosynthesis